MKKIIFVFLFAVCSLISVGQVFNNAQIIKKGHLALGFNPVLYNDDFGMFLHGGFGLTQGIDLGLKYGILDGEDYFGGDLEWKIFREGMTFISLVTGGHKKYDFGLDLGLNLTFALRNDVFLFSGFDSDIEFIEVNNENDTQFVGWIPVGVEILLRNQLAFILEYDIPVTDPAYNIFGGGVAIYF